MPGNVDAMKLLSDNKLIDLSTALSLLFVFVAVCKSRSLDIE